MGALLYIAPRESELMTERRIQLTVAAATDFRSEGFLHGLRISILLFSACKIATDDRAGHS